MASATLVLIRASSFGDWVCLAGEALGLKGMVVALIQVAILIGTAGSTDVLGEALFLLQLLWGDASFGARPCIWR